MKRFIRALAGCALAVAAAGTHAQAMYRCGKVFQDRPCDAGVTEQRILPGGGRSPSSTGAPAPAASSPYAYECARRGEHAQRITWQREGGATMERQVNDARGNRDMIELIQNVYARRGTAPEIRSAVESECLVEKQRAADAAAALATLQQQAGKAAAPAPVSAAVPAAAGTAHAQPAVAPSGPSPQCDQWRARRDTIESRLRQGGSAATMETWQRERRDVERLMAEGRC